MFIAEPAACNASEARVPLARVALDKDMVFARLHSYCRAIRRMFALQKLFEYRDAWIRQRIAQSTAVDIKVGYQCGKSVF
ncbi:unnamed protein product, partial [Iphiclides podalirius]